jgi:heme-degrading monooxygenase HmoA
MFIAMNRFQVMPGKEDEFEEIWRRRETYLEGVPGYVRFALLKSQMTPGEYVSHSTWKDRQSFVDWSQSEAFQKAHRQGSLAGVLQGPPMPGMYEAILEQGAA